MTDFDFDLFVIGGGSGGVRAARMSANYGAKVALAEEFRYGGTCVIRGCVPKKLLVYASSYSQHFADAAGFGWTVGKTAFDWSKLRDAKDAEITRLEGIYKSNLESAGVTVIHQRATVTSPHSVRLADGREFTTKHILIATGGTPFVPEIPGGHLAITSNEVFDIERLPKRVVIVGGGYIASEFAGIFNGLGSHVTQVYRRELILRGFDD
ncbi:MAG TPA: FAD-dependent oxidoreductase, partial [Devosiaceae bacterium]|nr:FAD-dependent oxidoreductase [Devosiaceae bacterium]